MARRELPEVLIDCKYITVRRGPAGYETHLQSCHFLPREEVWDPADIAGVMLYIECWAGREMMYVRQGRCIEHEECIRAARG
jgi:hypothetical protein